MGYLDWHEQPGYYRDVTVHFSPDAALLDIGCGSGWLGEHFRHYTGVDSSPEAVAAATARGRNVLEADADEPLPFDDASFDAAVLKDVLEHVHEPVALVREVAASFAPAVAYSPPHRTRSVGSGTTTPTGDRSRARASACSSPIKASGSSRSATSR